MWMKRMIKKKVMSMAPKIFSEPEIISMSTNLFITGAIASIIASFILQIIGQKEKSLWVGQWAPTLLLLGMYDRLYKMMMLFKRF